MVAILVRLALGFLSTYNGHGQESALDSALVYYAIEVHGLDG